MPATKEIVLSGPGKDPKYIPVDKIPFRIGKSPVNELQLSSKAIPRHQCDIIETETGYKLLDRSGKGTSVNGKKVKEAKLSDKSVIKIGSYQLSIRDIPAGDISTVTAVYGETDPKASKGPKKTVLSLVGTSPSGPIKVVLDGTLLNIGSSRDNDLVIKDTHASKDHCQCFQTNGVWSVADLESTNGTFVNDEKVTEKEIHPGMVLRVGKTNLHVLAGTDRIGAE